MPIKVGDRVITSKYSGTEITLHDETVSIVRINDILAVVE
jgi:chaperonin GroES